MWLWFFVTYSRHSSGLGICTALCGTGVHWVWRWWLSVYLPLYLTYLISLGNEAGTCEEKDTRSICEYVSVLGVVEEDVDRRFIRTKIK